MLCCRKGLARLFFAILISSAMLSMTACGHIHKWEDATCTAPKTCTGCRETQGEKLTHVVSDDGTCKLCEKEGKFIYQKYEDAPQWRRDVIRGHVIRFIKRNQLCTDLNHSGCKFVQEKFPHYWKEAVVLHEHGLL